MKSKFLLLTVACMLLVGMAAPAMAAEEPVGEQINVLGGEPATYLADEPFFILHGWGPVPATDHPIGRYGFRLDVDGVDQGNGKLLNSGVGGPDGVVSRLWLFNFDDGMPAGDVTFTGHWILPCMLAVDAELWFEACPTPNAQVDVFTISHTVSFTP